MARPSLHVAVAGTKNKASEYNENFDMMMDYCEEVSQAAKDYVDANVDGKAELSPTIITLTGTTPILTDNAVHQITVTATTTFNLPSASPTTKFHQMLVLLDMPTVQTINLGTDVFFYGDTPDLSEAGTYTLIYEYNGTDWVVGALFKAEEA